MTEGGALTLRDCAIVENLGSAIIAWGNLTVDNNVFSGNRVNDISTRDFGAAIYNGAGAATISDSTFHDNNAADGCGAIYNGAGMTIRNSTFSDNKINGTNSSQGGAICSPGALSIESSTFSGNYARCYGGTPVAGNGTITGSTTKDSFSPLGGYGIRGDTGLVVSRSILRRLRAGRRFPV